MPFGCSPPLSLRSGSPVRGDQICPELEADHVCAGVKAPLNGAVGVGGHLHRLEGGRAGVPAELRRGDSGGVGGLSMRGRQATAARVSMGGGREGGGVRAPPPPPASPPPFLAPFVLHTNEKGGLTFCLKFDLKNVVEWEDMHCKARPSSTGRGADNIRQHCCFLFDFGLISMLAKRCEVVFDKKKYQGLVSQCPW